MKLWYVLMRIVLKDELETSMKLCGVTSIEQLGPELLNTQDIDHLVPRDAGNPEKLSTPKL